MMFQPKHKRFILAAAVLALVAGVVTYVYQQKEPAQQETAKLDPAAMPPFAKGELIRVEGDNVYLKAVIELEGEKELVGKITPETKFVQEMIIRDIPGLAQVSKEALQPGQRVVVHFSNRNNTTFDIDKIQILN